MMIVRYINLLQNENSYIYCLFTYSIIINLLVLVGGGEMGHTFLHINFAQGCSRVLQQQFGWKPRRRPMPMSFILLPFFVIVVFLIIVIVIVLFVILVTFVCIFKWSRTKCPFLQAGPYF